VRDSEKNGQLDTGMLPEQFAEANTTKDLYFSFWHQALAKRNNSVLIRPLLY